MSFFTAYDHTGRITNTLMGAKPRKAELRGARYIKGRYDPATHYIVNSAAVKRVKAKVYFDTLAVKADGVTAAILTGLPKISTLSVGHARKKVLVPSGTYQFTSDQPGNYPIRFDEVAYLPETWTIQVR